MVRFIIRWKMVTIINDKEIYIPIWLDLLLKEYDLSQKEAYDLHSNMVRFIISVPGLVICMFVGFTFQYG